MPRRVQVQERTSPVLIVLLIVLILACLGMGAGTYYGFSQQKELRKEAENKEARARAAEQKNDWAQFKALLLQGTVGEHSLTKDEKDALTLLWKRYGDGKGELGKNESEPSRREFQKIYDHFVKDIDNVWDLRNLKPKKSLLLQIRDLKAEVAQKELLRAAADKDKGAAIEERDQTRAEKKKEVDGVRQELADNQKKYAEDLKKAEDRAGTIVGQANEDHRQLDAAKAEIGALQAKLLAKDAEIERIKKAFAQYKEDTTVKLDKYAKPDMLGLDKPKGKIFMLDRKQSLVHIDLGSKDNVKPDLTFSVFGVDSFGKPGKEPKGALRVVKVEGDHSSLARVTDVRDPGHDPIVTNDVLFNPAWSPHMRQHVAVAGLIDFGDGRDSSAEFVRSLEKQGIIVDAYLDLKGNTIRGPGITMDTNYLILGAKPQFGDIVRQDDPRFLRKQDITKLISKMEDDGREKGVTKVSVQKFMAMMGFEVPRGAGGAALSGYDAVVTPAEKQAPPAEKQDAPKPDKPKAKPPQAARRREPCRRHPRRPQRAAPAVPMPDK